jgi:hypothetical protein
LTPPKCNKSSLHQMVGECSQHLLRGRTNWKRGRVKMLVRIIEP